jgi:D-alanyl-D-alanine carboxypeptidase (penicillin-binding protein 5/6)
MFAATILPITMSDRPEPGSAHRFRSVARRVVTVAAVLGVSGLGAAGTLIAPAHATTPSPSAIPPTEACARAVSNLVDGKTTGPTPLPAPTSTLGGNRLSATGLQVDLTEGGQAPPAVAATAWLVADLTSGTVIASCNAHVPLAPASTLKILTSLTLAHELDWDALYVGQPDAPATDGSKVGIVTGGRYTVRDLFHGLMLSSGNDAATALATVAGGMDRTAKLMNTTAKRLGALDTHAVNDSGLDATGQVSSAYDLALLGRALLQDPLLADLVTTRSYPFPGKPAASGTPSTFQIQNHNKLLATFDGANGVKNGYTTAAGGSFVGSATRDGHTYLVTVLRAKGYTHTVAAELLDWAFDHGGATRPIGTLVTPADVEDKDAAGMTSSDNSTDGTRRGLGGVVAISGSVLAVPAVLIGLRNYVIRRRTRQKREV